MAQPRELAIKQRVLGRSGVKSLPVHYLGNTRTAISFCDDAGGIVLINIFFEVLPSTVCWRIGRIGAFKPHRNFIQARTYGVRQVFPMTASNLLLRGHHVDITTTSINHCLTFLA